MKKQQFKGEAFLTIAAIIWGTAFIFQKMGMDHLGPFAFNFYRFVLGAIVLLPFIIVVDSIQKKKSGPESVMKYTDRRLLAGGFWIGLSNFVAGSLQQIGLVYTTAGKAGFVTTLYIILVPVIMIFLRKRLGWLAWVSVAIAAFGLYLLCMTEGFTVELGDGILMGCALAYAFQIMLIDYYVEKCDAYKLSFYEFLISGIMCGIVALFVEGFELESLVACAGPILFCAVFEVAIAFTLQMVGQQFTPPTIAAIIMSLEGVFAVIADALFMDEIMSTRELLGCGLMLVAFVLIQLPAAQPKDLESLKEHK